MHCESRKLNRYTTAILIAVAIVAFLLSTVSPTYALEFQAICTAQKDGTTMSISASQDDRTMAITIDGETENNTIIDIKEEGELVKIIIEPNSGMYYNLQTKEAGALLHNNMFPPGANCSEVTLKK